MKRVNPQSPPKPCEYFDLIGGTSTGGIIAIMLGRLQMDIDACIDAYVRLSSVVFQPKRVKPNIFGRAKDIWEVDGAYSSECLASEIKAIVASQEGNDQARLMDPDSPCKTFVCAFTKTLNTPVLFRTYTTDEAVDTLASSECTIWQAARATSAAATFFDPVEIGRQRFIDGATGFNNPVEVVLDEAKSIWPDAISRIQCIVSIGTGMPNLKDFGDNLKEVVDTLKAISTETEETEKRFFKYHKTLGVSDRYFRYNVQHGLGDIGLDEHKKAAQIEAATERYLQIPQIKGTIDAFTAVRAPNTLIPLDEASKEKHLKWLKYVDPYEYHNPAREARTKSTGNWFLEGEFEQWRKQPRSFLWLYGNAGCGKTILSSTIIDQIADQIRQQKLGVLAFYYFSFRRKESQDVRLLLYSLLTQLVRGLVRSDPQRHNHYHLPRAFRELYSQYQPASEPKVEDLKATFLSVLAESEETYIVIDALDECPKPEDRESVVEFLIDFLHGVGSSMHILITSRQEKDIEDTISEVSEKNGVDPHRVPIKDPRVNADIKKHLETRIAEFKINIWSNKLKKEVIEQLARKAEGVFRYAECQLIELRRAKREKDIEEALKQLPKDLDETYSRMLSQPDISKYEDEVYTILQWLAFSSRPLKLNEAAEAVVFASDRSRSSGGNPVSVDPTNRFDPQDIRAILSGLVTVLNLDQYQFDYEKPDIGQDGVIAFAHFSVREYLECDRVEPKRFRLLESDAQWFILKSCFAYIHHYDNQPSKEAGSEQLPLLLYACKYWPYHAAALCYDKDEAPVMKLAKLLIGFDGPTLTLSARVALGSENSQLQEMLSSVMHHCLESLKSEHFFTKLEFDFESDWALHSASKIGERGLIKLLLDCGADVNKSDDWERAALHHAARNGHEAVVEQLLQSGADIEKEDYGGGTPLASAIENGCEAVIKLLLTEGAKVNYYYVPNLVSGSSSPLPPVKNRRLTPTSSAIAGIKDRRLTPASSAIAASCKWKSFSPSSPLKNRRLTPVSSAIAVYAAVACRREGTRDCGTAAAREKGRLECEDSRWTDGTAPGRPEGTRDCGTAAARERGRLEYEDSRWTDGTGPGGQGRTRDDGTAAGSAHIELLMRHPRHPHPPP
ncbi:hypothetical protein FGG08_003953 [Glutinoglossum americanum]|uniref:phospholipase A2 n=1 Tax=Glutinoglossum americanum TaxID=1670608 RepID=A0A9P8I8K9_9PEZI|nr:hypothetical protein FGG08_003953 [Glutinoglossum americanum]